MVIARSSMCEPGATCATDVGNVVARIEGAAGSAILVGLDRLTVCRCGGPSLVRRVPRAPWSYADLGDVAIGSYGSLPVILLHLPHTSEPLPILILERGQVGPALDGLVTLRRLIVAAAHPGSNHEHAPIGDLATRRTA